MGELVIKLIQDVDTRHEIDDEEMRTVQQHIFSEKSGVKCADHLEFLELEDLPQTLTVIKRRIILKGFKKASK